MILVTLPDGSTSFDSINDCKFHQTYNLRFGYEAKQSEPDITSFLIHLAGGKYGAYKGFVIKDESSLDESLAVHYSGVVTAGGTFVIGDDFHGIVYTESAKSFSCLYLGSKSVATAVSRDSIDFNSLLPNRFPMTPGASIAACCPESYAVVDGKVFEKFPVNVLAGYPSASYGVLYNRRLIKAFGIKVGGWTLDYLPTTIKGGLKSILCPQRASVKGKAYDHDEGVYIMSSSEVDKAVADLRAGLPNDNLRKLGVTYSRPMSDVFKDSGLLYVAALPTPSNYRKFKAKFGVVDPEDQGSFKGKSLNEAVLSCFMIDDSLEDEQLAAQLQNFSYILFDSEEVLDILKEYQNVYNKFIANAAEAAQKSLLEAALAYNEAVLQGYKENCSIISDEGYAESVVVKSVHDVDPMVTLMNFNIPIPVKKQLVDHTKTSEIQLQGSGIVSSILSVFRYFTTESMGYINTRKASDEEKEAGVFFPVTFDAASIKDAYKDVMEEIRANVSKTLVKVLKTFYGCEGENDWLNINGYEGRNSDSDSYNHGCHDVCSISARCFRDRVLKRMLNTRLKLRDGSWKDYYDSPAPVDVLRYNGHQITAVYLKRLYEDSGAVYVDIEFRGAASFAHFYDGLWSAQANCDAVNYGAINNMLAQLGYSDRSQLTRLGQLGRDADYGRTPCRDKWCRKCDYTWYGRGKDETATNPSGFVFELKRVKVKDTSLEIAPAKPTDDFDTVMTSNTQALLSAANQAAVKYLIDNLNKLGVLTACTFCGTSSDGQILDLSTLLSCTNFSLQNGEELIANLEKIRDAREISAVGDPNSYVDGSGQDSGNAFALSSAERDVINGLISALKTLSSPSTKVWFSSVSTPCLVKNPADMDIIPYICKL